MHTQHLLVHGIIQYTLLYKGANSLIKIQLIFIKSHVYFLHYKLFIICFNLHISNDTLCFEVVFLGNTKQLPLSGKWLSRMLR